MVSVMHGPRSLNETLDGFSVRKLLRLMVFVSLNHIELSSRTVGGHRPSTVPNPADSGSLSLGHYSCAPLLDASSELAVR